MGHTEMFEQQMTEEIGTLRAALNDIENAEAIIEDESAKVVPGAEYSPLTNLGTVVMMVESDLEQSHRNGEVSDQTYDEVQNHIEHITEEIEEARKNHVFYDREVEIPKYRELLSELKDIKPILEKELHD